MSASPFIIVSLLAEHDRSLFQCGHEPLDRYLREQVSQDIRRRVATCFAAIEKENRIVGYYTLASAGMPLFSLPPEKQKKLPRYPTVPTVRMGRLAVDQGFQGKRLGAVLLADAINRTMQSEIASYALTVDAKNENASSFYRHHGFIPLPSNPLILFFPFASLK